MNQPTEPQKPKKNWLDFVLLLGDYVAKFQPPILRALIHDALNIFRQIYFRLLAEGYRRLASRARADLKPPEPGVGESVPPGHEEEHGQGD